jgi:hypothetical protein
MGVKFGNTNIVNIFHGSTPITNIFKGSDLIFQLGGDVYELIADVNVTTATQQIDFTGLNITKDDELRLVWTFENSPSTSYNFFLYVNNNNTSTNYWRQVLYGDGSTIGAFPVQNSVFSGTGINGFSSGFTDIKVSNNDRMVGQSYLIYNGGSSIGNYNINFVSLFTVSSITQLSVRALEGVGILAGSRLQLYKVNKGSA